MTVELKGAAEDLGSLLQARYPGISLESPVQGWAYLGEFEKGIAEYQSLKAPTGKDDRWLGVCYFQTFEDMRAQEAFYRALAKGEEAARVNLAHLLRFLERSEEALAELARVDTKALSPYDSVLYLRVSSLHEEANGNIRRAVEFAERAWSRVQGIPEFQILAPSVLAQLGILYGRVGEARRALWFLEHGIKLTSGLERQKVILRRATLLIHLGRVEEADIELRSLGDVPEALDLERELLFGELAWYRGRLNEAMDSLEAVVSNATQIAAGSEEFTARLALSAILTSKGNLEESKDHLDKARILISDRTDVLLHRFRETLLNVRDYRFGEAEAASELQMLATEFEELGTLQEEAWVRLHLAETYRKMGDDRVELELRRVGDICEQVHNSVFLQREWNLLPALKVVAATYDTRLAPDRANHLAVMTIGQERLELNGAPVRLPVRRAVELFCYFLVNRRAPLATVLKDLFPGEKTRTAKSYFHQFRHQLSSRIPGIEIAYDPASRHYELRKSIDIYWDLNVVRRGGRPAFFGEFLPSTNGSWAIPVRKELMQLLEEDAPPGN